MAAARPPAQPLPLPKASRRTDRWWHSVKCCYVEEKPLTGEELGEKARNEGLAKAHFDRLSDRVKHAMRNIQVQTIKRVRVDGPAVPAEWIANGVEYWWYNYRCSGWDEDPDLVIIDAKRNTPPPPGKRRWCYTKVMEPASKVVPVVWDATLQEIVQLFAYFEYGSILEGELASCIEESRPSGRRNKVLPASANALRLVVWDLEDLITSHVEKSLNRWCMNKSVRTLCKHDEQGHAIIPPLEIPVTEIVPITEHESNVLQRRPHLKQLCRRMISGFWSGWVEYVDKEWRRDRYDGPEASVKEEEEEKEAEEAFPREPPSDIELEEFRQLAAQYAAECAPPISPQDQEPGPFRTISGSNPPTANVSRNRMDDSLVTESGYASDVDMQEESS